MSRRSIDIVVNGENRTDKAFQGVRGGLAGIKRQLFSMRNLAVGVVILLTLASG